MCYSFACVSSFELGCVIACPVTCNEIQYSTVVYVMQNFVFIPVKDVDLSWQLAMSFLLQL